MGSKGLSGALVLVGVGLVALSVTADAIGIGPGDYVFGWEQKLGVVVGASLAWVAALRLLGWAPSRGRQGATTQGAPGPTEASLAV